MLLLTFLAVAAAAASQDQQPEVEVSDVEDDLGLDEEELKVLMAERGENEEEEDDEEDERTVGKGHPVEDSASERAETDANVSFQVRRTLGRSLQCANCQIELKLLFLFEFTLYIPYFSQVTYKTPVPTGDVYFAETFDDGSLSR